ncbi:hypothetical protein [Paraburkholderia youngii]|uniref:hypothetical protein n=1 Tax=Paraburkholderia youngii TaxID=2782701 RepID=UPI003D1992A3
MGVNSRRKKTTIFVGAILVLGAICASIFYRPAGNLFRPPGDLLAGNSLRLQESGIANEPEAPSKALPASDLGLNEPATTEEGVAGTAAPTLAPPEHSENAITGPIDRANKGVGAPAPTPTPSPVPTPAPALTPAEASPSAPPSTAKAAPASAAFAAATDALVAAMQPANLAFGVPTAINLDDTPKIDLKIDLHKSKHELEQSVAGEGIPTSDTIKVSESMIAHLTSDDFTITPISPEAQSLSSTATTTWEWEIKPKTWGKLGLKLVLDAELGTGSADKKRFLQAYAKDIEVQVWPVHWRRIQDFATNNWQWLWTALLVPVAAWIYKKQKRKGKPDDMDYV